MNVLSNLVNIILSIWAFLFDFTNSGGNPFFIVFAVFILATLALDILWLILYWKK